MSYRTFLGETLTPDDFQSRGGPEDRKEIIEGGRSYFLDRADLLVLRGDDLHLVADLDRRIYGRVFSEGD